MKRLSLCLLSLFTLAACADDDGIDEYEAGNEVGLADDGVLGEEGLYDETATYAAWNVDNDLGIDETEFGTGFGGGAWWNDWDLDDDTYLDESEFTTAFADEPWYSDGLYSTWDADGDGLLTTDEWEAGLFDTWDLDDDGYITETEYDETLFA